MVLESYCHQASCFVTLTYSPDNYPPGGTLRKKDVQKFLKRLRYYHPRPIRYFACGEYGDESERAHYHLALFGIGQEYSGVIDQAWGLGHTYVGDLTPKSAQYIAGYVVKKMTAADDERLKGRAPEFAVMSRRPGIGAEAMRVVAAQLGDSVGASLVARTGDVPVHLQGARRKAVPLGRYLRRRLRDEMGFSDQGAPPGAIRKQIEELYGLLETAGSYEAFRHLDDTKVAQVVNRAKIWRKKGSL